MAQEAESTGITIHFFPTTLPANQIHQRILYLFLLAASMFWNHLLFLPALPAPCFKHSFPFRIKCQLLALLWTCLAFQGRCVAVHHSFCCSHAVPLRCRLTSLLRPLGDASLLEAQPPSHLSLSPPSCAPLPTRAVPSHPEISVEAPAQEASSPLTLRESLSPSSSLHSYVSADKQQQASEREAAPARPGPELQAQHAGGAQQRLLGKVTLHSDPEAPSAARGRGP